MFAIISLGKRGSTGLPILTILICVACAVVYGRTHGESGLPDLVYNAHTWDVPRMFISVFVHTDIWHLVGNLFFFFFFARAIETRISITGYLLSFVLFVLVTNIAFSLTVTEPRSTIGLSGVVWGYMGIFLLRYPMWIVEIFEVIRVPAVIFILVFLAFDVAEYRHLEHTGVNYIAHFSGFAAGVMFRLLFWGVFTTEKPEPKRKGSYPARPTHARSMRR